VLCTELDGEYVTNTRNPKYYGSCKVDNTAGGKGRGNSPVPCSGGYSLQQLCSMICHSWFWKLKN